MCPTKCLVLLSLFITNIEFSSQQTMSDLPNIVFIMADDLGYGDVGYNGGHAGTPNLDLMAGGANTIKLNRYYSGAPVCSPTRGSVLTGRNANRYCMWYANVGSNADDFVIPEIMPLPWTELTVAEVLKSVGYQTAMFGKWHLGDLKQLARGNPKWPVSNPGMHGFDEWLVTARSAPTYNLNCGCFTDRSSLCQPLGHYTSLPPCSNYYNINGSSNTLEQLDYPIRGDDSEFILNKFEDFLNRMENNSSPFFAYLSLHAVHRRYIASPENAEQYLSEHFNRDHADYYGAITAMDSAVGGVRRLLQEHNISHNTMLWFTSDNGPAGGTPGSTAGLRGSKGSLYEGGIRVPGLIEWPAVITSNRISDFPVVSNDLLPTFSAIVGFNTTSIGKELDGISLLPMIKNEQQMRNSSIKWAFKVPANFSKSYKAAIVDDRFKVYASYDQDRVISASLFDLVTDPAETDDIKSSHMQVFQSLKQELEEWRQSVIYSAVHEVQCYGNSSDYFFECEDKKLLKFNFRCNGEADCIHDTDEQNCEDCWYGSFHCNNNKCVLPTSVCNGRDECGDGSDEDCRLCPLLCNDCTDSRNCTGHTSFPAPHSTAAQEHLYSTPAHNHTSHLHLYSTIHPTYSSTQTQHTVSPTNTTTGSEVFLTIATSTRMTQHVTPSTISHTGSESVTTQVFSTVATTTYSLHTTPEVNRKASDSIVGLWIVLGILLLSVLVILVTVAAIVCRKARKLGHAPEHTELRLERPKYTRLSVDTTSSEDTEENTV